MTSADQAPGRAPAKQPPGLDRWDLFVVVAALVFMAPWWNRSLSPTQGLELHFAAEFERGRLPYRDYFLAITPGYVLWGLVLSRLAGPYWIAFLASGVLFRAATALALHRWVRRVAPGPIAALASLAAWFASQGDIADYPGWYTYQTCIWTVFAGLASARALEAGPGTRDRWWLLAGVILGLNLVTKQSNGLVLLAAGMGLAVCLEFRRSGPVGAVRPAAVQLFGAAIPVVVASLWLVHHGAFQAFVDQAFLKGPAAKGGFLTVLLRPLVSTAAFEQLLTCLLWALAVLAALEATRLVPSPRGPYPAARPLTTLLFLATAAAGARVAWLGGIDSRTPNLIAVYLAVLGTLLTALRSLPPVLRGKEDEGCRHRLLMAGYGFAAAAASSFSWAAFEPMLLPALAVYGADLLVPSPGRFGSRTRVRAVALSAFLLIGLAVYRKHRYPYIWGYWSEPPVVSARVAPSHPVLAGMRLSSRSTAIYDELARVLAERTRPGDAILAFPHMPMVHVLGDRRPFGKALIYWMDVCPDELAEREARALVETPPAAIVILRMPEELLTTLEATFRGGKPGGQRRMLEAIESVLPGYTLVASHPVPGTGLPLEIWVRSPAGPPGKG